jgi:hypothetical protein
MMQFIILGYIPGTSIQITFEIIAYVAAIATAALLSRLARKGERPTKQQRVNAIDTIAI